MRILLFAEPTPRSGAFIGLWTLLLPIGRCTPRLFIETAGRSAFAGPLARWAPAFQFGREPIPY
jgi:hypothetical protein